MNAHNYPAVRSNAGIAPGTSGTTVNAALTVGGAAMIIGAATGLAQGLTQARDGSMTAQQVAAHTAKEAMGTGIAVAAGAAVASALGMRGILGLAGMVVVGAAAKYTWDNSLERAKDLECLRAQPAAAETTPAKSSAKKPAPKAAK
ncbi:hypothetical protein DPQ33_11070 [Oceanidesulfovibrio indonesiensis]|uniref:Uncharacterized protein n=1 Tax=Oceanidesulfovibrio indonesiensis TaxID=54767 RepID=A0A7M3ME06_9BACT|nr:magnetosome protein MamC [Oceanidesulfovibrio indonesiensis]TVM16936.1 hypothetical protein DPQ33_11070 [Oceanidesulfovibrio indonesiensis]